MVPRYKLVEMEIAQLKKDHGRCFHMVTKLIIEKEIDRLEAELKKVTDFETYID